VKAPQDRVPRMLPLAELAERLQVSIKTIRRTLDRGELRAHRVGRQLRISEADALGFIERGRR
jgi:excisionase family DNA binding protein